MTKVNREEQTEEVNVEKLMKDESMLMLKIQRLGKDDFFISISRKGLITHLKEKILTFVKAEQSETDNPELGVKDMRLIYKGKVLVDSNPLDFYKIQNNDTIQLCPFRRKKRAQNPANPAGGPADTSGAEAQNEDGQQQVVAGPGEFTFISFSLTEQPINIGGRNSSSQNATRNQTTQTSTEVESSNQSSSTTTSIRSRLILPVISDHTPTTITGNLRNFKSVLQETLRRLSETNVENSHELITQLDVLIRRATTLRGGLSASEEKEDVPATESNTTNLNPELVTSHTGSIDIHAESRIPSVLRYLPLRLNMGAAIEFPVVTINTDESSADRADSGSGQVAGASADSGSGQVAGASADLGSGQVAGAPADSGSGQVAGASADSGSGQVAGASADSGSGPVAGAAQASDAPIDRAGQPRIIHRNQAGYRPEHRNTHSRNIFNILINRFDRG